MSILCSISAIKQLPRTIKKNHFVWQQVSILAIHVTGVVSVWFPFLMYPLSLQELGSDNTVYLDLNLLRSIVKRSKELSKLQGLWDFSILFRKFIEKTNFSLVPSYYGLSLLRTLSLTPEGVRNNASRLYTYTYDITSAQFWNKRCAIDFFCFISPSLWTKSDFK